mmetsp:Transcript_7221/g.14983  ORF Transcript_7221/g.14983 Transcript_7221/m.14983 type:complete len:261 (-) Transcript_7221:51-833(-)
MSPTSSSSFTIWNRASWRFGSNFSPTSPYFLRPCWPKVLVSTVSVMTTPSIRVLAVMFSGFSSSSVGTEATASVRLSATSSRDLAKLVTANCFALPTSRLAIVRAFSASARARSVWSLRSFTFSSSAVICARSSAASSASPPAAASASGSASASAAASAATFFSSPSGGVVLKPRDQALAAVGCQLAAAFGMQRSTADGGAAARVASEERMAGVVARRSMAVARVVLMTLCYSSSSFFLESFAGCRCRCRCGAIDRSLWY